MNSRIIRTPLEPRIAQVDFKDHNGKDLLTWWYVALIKGRSATYQPKVLVCFRVLGPNDELTTDYVHRLIALTALGQFRIGTIWRNNTCRQQIKLEVETFQLDFDNDSWLYNSIAENMTQGRASLIPNDVYELHQIYDHHKTWLLQFKFSNDPVGLLLPSLEFFSRCYGRSEHVKRILATYPWDVAKPELLAPLVEPATPGTWPINMKKRTVNGDVVLLAHLEYDQYAQQQAKEIWAQLEAAQGTLGTDRVFTKVGPWFQGPARLKVKGIWIEDRRKFLGLQIIGCSDPDGVPIYRDRENTAKTGPLPGQVKSGGTWNGVPPREIKPKNEIVNVTSSEAPDHGSSTIEIEDPEFELLGKPRFVKDIYRSSTNINGPGTRTNSPYPDRYSGDENSGTGKGVGYGSFNAKTVMESHGALRDVWNMLKFLETHHPDIVRKVEYLTPDGKFSDDSEPASLIGFAPFTHEDLNRREVKEPNWPLLDKKNNKVRGALLARVDTPAGHIHFFEIQRKPRTIRKEGEKERQGEQPFKGLVFMFANQTSIVDWVKHLLDEIRYTSGVFKKFAFSDLTMALTLKHVSASGEKLPQERFVKRALSMMGVDIPDDPASVRLTNTDTSSET